MTLEETLNALARELTERTERVRKIVEDLSEEELRALAAMCRREALPDETKNFAMPEWDMLAEDIMAELGYRIAFREADAYFKSTGKGFFCVTCRGDCKGHDE